MSFSLHLSRSCSSAFICVGFRTPPGAARWSPAASGLCTFYRFGNPVGKEMRIHFLTVPVKVQSPDWPEFQTMPMLTAILWPAQSCVLHLEPKGGLYYTRTWSQSRKEVVPQSKSRCSYLRRENDAGQSKLTHLYCPQSLELQWMLRLNNRFFHQLSFPP